MITCFLKEIQIDSIGMRYLFDLNKFENIYGSA